MNTDIEPYMNIWRAVGGASLVTALFTYLGTKKMTKAKVNKAEEEAEGQGIQNLDKILELNSREITRIEKSFKSQLEPLHQIIAEQKIIIESQKLELVDLENQNKKYLEKYGKLE